MGTSDNPHGALLLMMLFQIAISLGSPIQHAASLYPQVHTSADVIAFNKVCMPIYGENTATQNVIYFRKHRTGICDIIRQCC